MSESSPGAGERAQFEQRVVKVVRGRERITKTKLENQGWEFVGQSTGTLRTEMTFRRPNPKSLLAKLAAGWASFRTLPSKAQAVIAAVAGVAVVALIVAVAVSSNGDKNTTPTAGTHSTATASPNSETPPSSSNPTPSTTTPEPPQSSSDTDEPITVKNNQEFASIAKVDYCSDEVAAFASKYAGRTVEFDGSISAMNNHNDYKTRYDILISMGTKGSEATLGPAFQFNNVGMYDLHLIGDDSGTVGVDDRMHIVAEVGDFSAQHGCLFQLDPISTEVQ